MRASTISVIYNVVVVKHFGFLGLQSEDISNSHCTLRSMTAQTQEEQLAAQLEQKKIHVISLSLSRYMFVHSLLTVSIEQRLVICDSSLDWLMPSGCSFIYCFGIQILPGFVFLGIIFGLWRKLSDLENDLERFYGWNVILFVIFCVLAAMMLNFR